MLKHTLFALAALALPAATPPAVLAHPPLITRGGGTIHLEAMAASNGLRFAAIYDATPTKAGVGGFLRVYAAGYPASAVFPIFINGKVMGEITTNKVGAGEVKFRSYPGMPAILPSVSPNDIISAGPLKARFQ